MEWRPYARRPIVRTVRFAGFGLLVVALGLAADSLLLPLVVRGFVGAVELIMNACVWVALSFSAGMSARGMVGVVGRAVGGLVTAREVSVALTVLVAVGVLAAYGLQHVLGSAGDEEESSR